MAVVAMRAAEQLESRGISAEVVDLRTLSPLDSETVVESVRKTGHAVVVEETWYTGGFGATVVGLIQEHGPSTTSTRPWAAWQARRSRRPTLDT